MPNEKFDARLEHVPLKPGVYLMKDAAGSVIYVGKAKALRRRLRSYFGPRGPVGNAKVRAMVERVADFDFVICENELEALVLEANFIKSHRPFFNILLRDDRDYPYLRITMQEAYPRVMKAYRIGPDRAQGAEYYGPFLAGDLHHALRVIHELFPLKTCKREFPRDIGKERPCLNYHIHRCVGPCTGEVSEEAYRAVMREVCDFLEGRYSGIVLNIKRRMEEAAQGLRFEEAAGWRDRLQRLERLLERQVAVTEQKEDCDALALARGEGLACVVRLVLREGKVVSGTTHFMDDKGEADEELLSAFIGQYYGAERLPGRLLLPFTPAGELADFLSALCKISSPKRGEKSRLIDMARNTAREALLRKQVLSGKSELARSEGLRLLGQLCGCGEQGFQRIEAYDISNLAEDDKACGMVVFEGGRPKNSAYRRFRIKTVAGQDDYASMREALARRLARSEDGRFAAALPQLILLDGGAQHVAVIAGLLAELGLSVPLAGMVKDARHRTRGLALPGGELLELAQWAKAEGRGAQPDAGAPRRLEAHEAALVLRLLARIQDEAHRFAGRYSRKLGQKRNLRYRLEAIPGIGPKRRDALLKAFGSLRRIAAATSEELCAAVPALGARQAEAVYAHFHGAEQGTEERP